MSTDDAEIIVGTEKEPEGPTNLKVAHNGDEHVTVYDPRQTYTGWMTVPDSMWVEVENER